MARVSKPRRGRPFIYPKGLKAPKGRCVFSVPVGGGGVGGGMGIADLNHFLRPPGISTPVQAKLSPSLMPWEGAFGCFFSRN